MLVRIKWTNQQTETNWLDTWQNLNPLSKKCMDTREESLRVDLDQLKPFDDFSTRMFCFFCYNYFVSKRQQNFCSITMWNTILRTMILSRKRWLNSIIIEEKKGKDLDKNSKTPRNSCLVEWNLFFLFSEDILVHFCEGFFC